MSAKATTTDLNHHYGKPTHVFAKLNSMEYIALLIICCSIILKLFCITENNLLVEEAYYWNYAQHLDFGYLDHPPMVALLIKITTTLFGTNEFGVRIATLLCWMLTAFFSFKLTNLIDRGAGIYAVMLLAILPYFFIQSLIITPDSPLIACWAAALYCLYRSLILNESKYWYVSGLCVGLGLVSKYTILLLAPSTLLYLCVVPAARPWLARKEPYLCALIAALFFTPVIYWNATHEWASFIFQSTRRINGRHSFSLYQFIGLLILFLLPPGLWSLWALFKNKALDKTYVDMKTKRFMQVFTLVPLVVFASFSLQHGLKFNWIGPGLLALIPWLAILIKHNQHTRILSIRKSWLVTSLLLFVCYTSIISVIALGTPEAAYRKFFFTFISWDNLSRDVNAIAMQVEAKTGTRPTIAPLDLYNIGSELAFYQQKFLVHGETQESYPIIGRHIFGAESLMYRYWAPNESLSGKTLIVISNDLKDFNNPVFKNKVIEKSPIETLWSHSQVRNVKIIPYYYQVVQMKAS